MSGERLLVGQPILAAAGFQPATARAKHEGSLTALKSRLKGGCGQDCPPHNLHGSFSLGKFRTRGDA
jgi:hypothetical protein